MNNKNTKETFLQHWALLEGAKAKIHKYIAREDTGRKNKKGNNVYRYFYSQSAYDAFKNKAKQVADTTKSWINKASKATQSAAKDFVDTWLTGIGKQTKYESERRARIEEAKEYVRTMDITNLSKHVSVLNPSLGKDAAMASADTQRGTREPTYTTKSGHVVYENTSGKGKWIAKVKLASGKTRYFYDSNSYKRWKEVQNYQDAEPEFLKKYKEIEPSEEGKMSTQYDDCLLTNDISRDRKNGLLVPESSQKRSTNCIYCAMTYELRRRGYDVEAKARSSTHGVDFYSEVYMDDWDRPIEVEKDSSWYRNYPLPGGRLWKPDTLGVTDVIHTEHVTSVVIDEDDVHSLQDQYKKYGTTQGCKIKSDSMYEQLDKDMPNGSRGSVNCFWYGGGGHAFIWEKDEKGHVRFYDPQINAEYSKSQMDELRSSMDPRMPVIFVRTDDLLIRNDAEEYFQERVQDGPDGEADEWYESKRRTNKRTLL